MVRRRVDTFLIIGVIILLPLISPNAHAEPPNSNVGDECLIYAYSESGNHLFLLESNKSAFGNNVTIIHNCESIEVYVNGSFEGFTNTNMMKIILPSGNNDIIINSPNSSKIINDIFIMPDRLSWEFEYFEWDGRNSVSFEEYISLSKAQAKENWVSILSIVVVFTLSTMVYWNLINAYIDRNYCEEVVN